MPVQLRRDEFMESVPPRRADVDRADLLAAALLGVRAAVVCLVPSSILFALLMRKMAGLLRAGEELARASEGYYLEVCMPVVLSAFLGAVFGALVGWRVSASVGLAGGVGWTLAIGTLLALTAVTVATAAALFPHGVPGLVWACLAFMTFASAVGLYLFTAWTH